MIGSRFEGRNKKRDENTEQNLTSANQDQLEMGTQSRQGAKRPHRALKCAAVCVIAAVVATGCSAPESQEAAPTMDIGEPNPSTIEDETKKSEALGQQLAVEYIEVKATHNQTFLEMKKQFEGIDSKEAIKEALEKVQSDSIAYAYLAFEDNTFFMTPQEPLPEGYKPTERPWYQGAIESGHYEEEYLDAFKEFMYYSISEPIENSSVGEVVLGVDFILEDDIEKAEAYSNYLFDKREKEAAEMDVNIIDAENNQENEDSDDAGRGTLPSFADEPEVFLTPDQLSDWEDQMEAFAGDIDMFKDGTITDKNTLVSALDKLCSDNRNVENAYIASPTGAFYINGDIELPSDYDPRQRPWYDAALSQDGLYLAEPYMDAATGKVINSIFVEIPAAPESGWVIGIDLMRE